MTGGIMTGVGGPELSDIRQMSGVRWSQVDAEERTYSGLPLGIEYIGG